MNAYSRENPSPRYRELLVHYAQMHRKGNTGQTNSPERTYAGGSLRRHLPAIRALARRTGAKSLLDYGSGKGILYKQRNLALASGEIIPSVAEYLGVEKIVCFDPGVPEFSAFPSEKFDGVVSTDVLEHCPEEDIPWIVELMFTTGKKFIFANVASYPAAKTLPNGENAHCTQRPPAWWSDLLRGISARHPGVIYRFEIIEKHRGLVNKLLGRRWTTSAVENSTAD
ncbi:MAG TPA: hypothetical protein VKT73_09040 [Xanthobacteraceae bacterium]|nr:hypothetical protein [Xanthobacteraceae bacterium]